MNLADAKLDTMHGATVNSYELVHRTICSFLFISLVHLNSEVTRDER